MSDLKHDIERYHNGEMSPQEMHALERKALDDPFLSDAIEGASMLSKSEFDADVNALQQKVLSRPKSYWYWSMRVAAAVTVIAVATFILWPADTLNTDSEMLTMEKKEAEESLQQPEITEEALDESENIPAEEHKAEAREELTLSEAENDQDVKRSVKKKTDKPLIAQAEPRPATGPPVRSDSSAVTETLAGITKIKSSEGSGQTVQSEDVTAADDAVEQAIALKADEIKKEEQRAQEEAVPMAAERKVARMRAAQPTPSTIDLDIATRRITGTVTDGHDPLPGVNVLVKGSNTGTVTDADGNYSLTISNETASLTYSFIGLKTIEKDVPADKNVMDVQLQPDETELSEVIVTGYSYADQTTPEVATELAHPEMGSREFKNYLEKNVLYPEEAITNKVEGRVTIEFSVMPNGSLGEFNIIRGIGAGCDDELIRLVKESKWIPTTRNNVPVKDKARVRLRFKLPQ